MITVSNYHQKVTPEIVKSLPPDLQKSHQVFEDIVQFYNDDEDLRETVDLHIEVLNIFLSKKQNTKAERKKENNSSKMRSLQVSKSKKSATEIKPPKIKAKPSEVSYVFHEDKDFYFLKRFLNLIDKPKSRHQIGLYIKALQRAIVSKEIRKSSKHADHIMAIQEKLCKLFNSMKDNELVPLEVTSKWKEQLTAIVSREKVYRSVMLIKRYIGLEGKRAPEKVKLLLKAIENAFKKKEITKDDPYYEMIDRIRKNLKQSSEGSTVKIEQAELAGLMGIVEEFEEQEVSGLNMCDGPINSVEFAKMRFKTLGFTGKWRDFIGDPTHGFTALVYGKPKSGKSTLCGMLAGYLATLGKVLYVSKEEGKNGILQERMIRVNATHPNLDIDDHIPYDKLKDYDYLVLDSVHKLGLDEETLDQLPKKYPHLKGHIFIMHSTKGGDFRGSQTYAHNVDVLINVDEEGVATQTGRFAQGSKMEIFNNSKAT